MQAMAAFVRSLDPRLKMFAALLLGPSIWIMPPLVVAACGIMLFPLVVTLSASQPLGSKMIRSLVTFLVFWIAIKVGLDAISGVPVADIAMAAGVLGLRLATLLLLGLALALSTSARSLGLAVSWAVRPFVGKERAWKIALSLALMVHFLPMCLSTMNQVKETAARRCPHFSFIQKMTVIPQAVLRGLGQKTWNQTLAIAGRGLEGGDAWQDEFVWQSRDTLCSVLGIVIAVSMLTLS